VYVCMWECDICVIFWSSPCLGAISTRKRTVLQEWVTWSPQWERSEREALSPFRMKWLHRPTSGTVQRVALHHAQGFYISTVFHALFVI